MSPFNLIRVAQGWHVKQVAMISESKLEARDACEALLAPIWRCVQPRLGGAATIMTCHYFMDYGIQKEDSFHNWEL